ncbi:MAG: hypothetical protein Q8S33_28705 [Myxococcales bacterium]|nr:hypothetical protein [Myxococcales bacterium]
MFLLERLIDGPKRRQLEEPREAGFSPQHPRDRQHGIEACLPAFLETLHCREPEPGPLRQVGLGQVGVEPQLLRALGDFEAVTNASKLMCKRPKIKLTPHF